MQRRYVFRPVSMAYYLVLFLLLFFMIPYILSPGHFIESLGMSPEVFSLFLASSLVGSNLNIPLFNIESKVPMYTVRNVRFFGVNWRIPEVKIGVRKTLVTLNVGGAVVPVLLSLYLLVWSIPSCSLNPLETYKKTLIVLLTVTIFVNRSSRLIKGLGIATPAVVPPFTTAIATYLVYSISDCMCPVQIAYIGGTLGALIGADLMNINKLSTLGSPVVSIGGAGTFDGIYTTGIISVLLILFLT